MGTIYRHTENIRSIYIHVTKIFSYVYEPNVHLKISECVTIFYHLLKHSHDDTNVFLKSIVTDMVEK